MSRGGDGTAYSTGHGVRSAKGCQDRILRAPRIPALATIASNRATMPVPVSPPMGGLAPNGGSPVPPHLRVPKPPLRDAHLSRYDTGTGSLSSASRMLRMSLCKYFRPTTGPVGTGKTYLIRSLLSEVRDRRAILCSPASHFLEQGGRLLDAVNVAEKSFLILEDLGDLLAKDNVSRQADLTANLLNFTDGLVSLFVNTIVVLTFNHEMEAMNPAVLRPGRCLASIRTSLLPHEQALNLAEGDLAEQRSYSLAEVYQSRRKIVTPMVPAGWDVGGRERLGFGAR